MGYNFFCPNCQQLLNLQRVISLGGLENPHSYPTGTLYHFNLVFVHFTLNG